MRFLLLFLVYLWILPDPPNPVGTENNHSNEKSPSKNSSKGKLIAKNTNNLEHCFHELMNKYVQEDRDYFLAIRKSKSIQEKTQAEQKKPNNHYYLAQIDHYLDDYPHHELAIEMVKTAMWLSELKEKKYFNYLLKYEIKNPRIILICDYLANHYVSNNCCKDCIALLEEIRKQNQSTHIQGVATFALANQYIHVARKIHKEIESDPKTIAPLSQIEVTYRENAVKHYEEILSLYGNVEFEHKTSLKQLVVPALFELRFLGLGKPLPNSTGKTLDGSSDEFKKYQGKVLVIHFWATWCPPSRKLLFYLDSITKKFPKDQIQMIHINLDEEADIAKKFLKNNPISGIHWWDEADSGLQHKWNIRQIPALFIIDNQGIIRAKNVKSTEIYPLLEKYINSTDKSR